MNELLKLFSAKGRDANRAAILLAVLWCAWRIDKLETRVTDIDQRLPRFTAHSVDHTNHIATIP